MPASLPSCLHVTPYNRQDSPTVFPIFSAPVALATASLSFLCASLSVPRGSQGRLPQMPLAILFLLTMTQNLPLNHERAVPVVSLLRVPPAPGKPRVHREALSQKRKKTIKNALGFRFSEAKHIPLRNKRIIQ